MAISQGNVVGSLDVFFAEDVAPVLCLRLQTLYDITCIAT